MLFFSVVKDFLRLTKDFMDKGPNSSLYNKAAGIVYYIKCVFIKLFQFFLIHTSVKKLNFYSTKYITYIITLKMLRVNSKYLSLYAKHLASIDQTP